MPGLTLFHPVYTLDQQQLFPAGTVVTREILKARIDSDETVLYKSLSMLQYGSVKQDLTHLITPPPFKIIFNEPGTVHEVFSIMDQVSLPIPFLESLDFFRKHDAYTYRHILIVFALSALLTRDLIPQFNDQIHNISTSPIHDIGKVCVPLHILKKCSPLTRRERDILMNHTTAGYVLSCYYLRDTEHSTAIVARDHHERRDGSGHPRGIRLNDLMVEIVAVCDVYDALISPRPYRPVSFDNRTALEEITAMAERNKIGWEVVRALVSHNRKNKPHHGESMVSLEKRGIPPKSNIYGVIDEGGNGS